MPSSPSSQVFTRCLLGLVAPSALYALSGRLGTALVSHVLGPCAVALCLGLVLDIPYARPAALAVSGLVSVQALWATRDAELGSYGLRGVLAGVFGMTYWPFVLVAAFAVSPLELYRVPTTSMEPTLAPGDLLLMDLWAYTERVPERGDVVIFHAPGPEPLEYVKRVVGLPGETISVRGHRAWVGGQPLAEPYVQIVAPRDPAAVELANVGPVTVPPGHLFVLGDNRARSADSRVFGSIPFPLVRGRVLWVVWPFSRSRTLGSW